MKVLKEQLTYRLKKSERLKSRSVIQEVFNHGKQINCFPVKSIYLNGDGSEKLQAGFSVSKRYFKKAVDRNRIKRLMREAYRLQKHSLEATLNNRSKSLAIFFVFMGNEIAGFETINQSIGKAIKKLIQLSNETVQQDF